MSHFNNAPVDKSTIKTRIHLHRDFINDQKIFFRNHNIKIRTIKLSRGSRAGLLCTNLTLDILTYKGIKVKLVILDHNSLAYVTIEFNPGKCLYGHNGRILSLSEFLDSLTLLASSLAPLLHKKTDWVYLIPGLMRKGRAYWSYLEIPFQCRDPDGRLLAQLRHLRHPSIHSASRHWPDSIQAGAHKSKLKLSIYRKAIEMVVHNKLNESRLPDAKDILRLEVRLKDDKLIGKKNDPFYFHNNRNIQVINGKERLVQFYPQDLVQAHRAYFSKLQGVFNDVRKEEASGPLAAMGRLLAQVADDPRVTQSYPELLQIVKHYTGGSARTISNIRNAGLTDLAGTSHISSASLFSDDAYSYQFGIASENQDQGGRQKVRHDHIDLDIRQLISKTYYPPGQKFFPHIELPSYCR